MSELTKGKGGRPPRKMNPVMKERKSFKWTAELQMKMAEYVRENYKIYQDSLTNSKKMAFLRSMRDALELSCNDTQLKNGFLNFLKKYESVKKKLNSSGFGIDPERDSTLSKGWILKNCPYFEVLEEVLGCRPNLRPPAVVTTAIINENEQSGPAELGSTDENEEISISNDQMEIEVGPLIDGEACEMENNDPVHKPSLKKNDMLSVKEFVSHAVDGIVKAKDTGKSPMNLFSKIMSERLEQTAAIESQKIKAEENRFEIELELRKEQIAIEKSRVDLQNQIELQKLDLEKKKMEERAAERSHEVEKLRMQQEFELKKLELQYKFKDSN